VKRREENMKSIESDMVCKICGSHVYILSGHGNYLKMCNSCGNRDESKMMIKHDFIVKKILER
jgi:hypothetical protein